MNKSNIKIRFIDRIKLLFIKLLYSKRSYEKKKIKYSIPMYNIISNPKLIMVLLIKNEEDIIRENLEFHKAMGIDGFIVTDNGSTDNSYNILNKYKKKGWVLEIIEEKSTEYRQEEFVNRMIKLAISKYKADWIISADADEFWRAKSGNLKTELSDSMANLIYVPIFNMLDEGKNWIENTSMIIRELPPKDVEKLTKANKLSVFNQFSRQIPKVMIRGSEYRYIEKGNHAADMKIMHKKIVSTNTLIYHYNSRGKERFKMKMIEGGKSLQYCNKNNQGAHWRYFYQLSKTNSDMDIEYYKNTGKYCYDVIKKIIKTDTFVYDFFKLQKISTQFPKIMDFREMLKKIKQGASIARFGDAEFDIALQRNKNDPYQKPSDELSLKLLSILNTPCSEKLIVCIPPFNSERNNIKNFKKTGLSFWQWYWKERFDSLSNLFINSTYGNSFFSRDAVFYELKVDDIKQIWNNKNVVFVISPDGRFIFDDRLFNNIKSKYEIHIPATNAFSEYSRILSECIQYPKDYLFFVSAGPTATVLAADLSKRGYQCLDMGHFSNCYLQYLGEARAPEHLPMTKSTKKKHKTINHYLFGFMPFLKIKKKI